MRPNLFKLATKELSQDAFIAWLLQWANPSCDEDDPNLHLAAKNFLCELISMQGTPPSEIKQVEAGRQWENIDVWANVNKSHLIIIEDKVGTGPHSNQLSRYRATAENWCKENEYQLICIYIKTQSDSALNLENVERQGFSVLNRKRLLELLNIYNVENSIYCDFRDNLYHLEQTESEFSQKLIKEWSAGDWKGFYQAIEQTRPIVNWGYVNNPAGGFWNLILNWFEHEDACPYMQIEQGSLCFKVGEVYDSRRDIRTRFHDLLMSYSTPKMGLQRPDRFGSGIYMTVAFVPRQVWLGADEEVINFDEALSRLNSYEAWLRNILNKIEKSHIVPNQSSGS